jgi:hypothetical protein
VSDLLKRLKALQDIKPVEVIDDPREEQKRLEVILGARVASFFEVDSKEITFEADPDLGLIAKLDKFKFRFGGGQIPLEFLKDNVYYPMATLNDFLNMQDPIVIPAPQKVPSTI